MHPYNYLHGYICSYPTGPYKPWIYLTPDFVGPLLGQMYGSHHYHVEATNM